LWGGHTHTFMYTPKDNPPSVEVPYSDYPYMVTQDSGKRVPVVQAYCHSKYLGRLELTFDENGSLTNVTGQPILMDSSIAQDEDVLIELSTTKSWVEHKASTLVGKSNVALLAGYQCYFGECNLGNLITDAYVDYVVRRYEGYGWTSAPIGIIQIGGIRTTLTDGRHNGNITTGDVMTLMPFENDLFKVGLPGSAILELLEYGISRYEKDSIQPRWNEFLQVSGMKIVYDVDREPGLRVMSVKMRCGNCSVPSYELLNKDEIYSVLMSSFLVHTEALKDVQSQKKFLLSVGPTDTATVIDYLKIRSPVYPGIEGRIDVKYTKTDTPRSNSAGITPTPFLFILCSFLPLALFNY